MAINFFNSLAVGTNVLYVDTLNDRVGIGTSSPSFPLEVDGGTGDGVKIKAGNTSNDDSFLIANSSNTTLFVVDGGGEVGIGTSSPSDKLEVNGAIRIADQYELKFGGTTASIFGSSSLNQLRFYTNNTERIRIDSNGVFQLTESSANGYLNGNGTDFEIDINRNPETGTFSDTGKSHARINLRAENGGSRITFNTASANNTVASERLRIGPAGQIGIGGANYGTSGQVLTSNGSGSAPSWQNASGSSNWTLSGNDIYNNNSGNVGIGTTSPGYKLAVSNGTHTLSVNPHAAGIDLHSTGNLAPHYQTDFTLYTGAIGSGTARLRVDSSGNVGIGTTSPASKLHIQNSAGGSGGYLKITDVTYGGDVRFGMADGVNNDVILGSWTNNSILVYTNTAERVRITNTGNVGIG
jgi:hypothetical protein